MRFCSLIENYYKGFMQQTPCSILNLCCPNFFFFFLLYGKPAGTCDESLYSFLFYFFEPLLFIMNIVFFTITTWERHVYEHNLDNHPAANVNRGTGRELAARIEISVNLA